MTASQAVKQAQANPEQWFGDGRHEDEVLFANSTFTVGSNGDYEDFYTAADAEAALANSWRQEDKS